MGRLIKVIAFSSPKVGRSAGFEPVTTSRSLQAACARRAELASRRMHFLRAKEVYPRASMRASMGASAPMTTPTASPRTAPAWLRRLASAPTTCLPPIRSIPRMSSSSPRPGRRTAGPARTLWSQRGPVSRLRSPLPIAARSCWRTTGAGVVAAAHAGWRGAAGGVIEATIAAMERCGADRERIVAALGPMIRQPSYEVGPEFVAGFTRQDAGQCAVLCASSAQRPRAVRPPGLYRGAPGRRRHSPHRGHSVTAPIPIRRDSSAIGAPRIAKRATTAGISAPSRSRR